MRSFFTALLSSAVFCCLAPSLFAAENPGQADLDKAFELRLSAKSLAQMEEVIVHSRAALKKGLDAENTKFARGLLAGTLYQRGEALAEAVLEASRPDPRLPEMRITALDDLTEALENDENLPQAQLLLGRLELLPGGDLKRARTAFDACIKSEAAEPETRSSAYLYRSALSEKAEERLADLDAAVKANPQAAQAYRVRAALKLSQEKADEAVADFDKALEIEPDHAATYEARGLALAAQEKWEEAKKSLSRAVELFPQASGALLQRGRISMLAGDHKQAGADAEAVLKLVPEQPEALLLRSHARFQSGDAKGALADVDSVLEKLPNAPQGLRTRIAINLSQQKYEPAIVDLERLVKLEPNEANTSLQLAALLNTTKRNKPAIELLDRILVRDSRNWRALRIRADAKLALGLHDEAVADYESALVIEPKDSGLLNNLAWLLATSPEAKVRNGKRSVELAESACQVTDYKEAHILSTLAAGYAEQGDFKSAIKWINKALEAADGEEKESIKKELASYEAEKPWREKLEEAPAEPKPDAK